MNRKLIVPLMMALAGCTGLNTGGSTDGGSTTTTPTGSLAFTVAQVSVTGNPLANGGFDDHFVRVLLSDKQVSDVCSTTGPAYHAAAFSIDSPDGSALSLGTHPISPVKQEFISSVIGDFDPSTNQASNVIGSASGTFTVTRNDSERMVGSFDATYVYEDGGAAGTLQASFDAPKTPCGPH